MALTANPLREMWSSENQREEGGFSGGDRFSGSEARQNVVGVCGNGEVGCRKFVEMEGDGPLESPGGTVRRGICG